jgi:hypothetical protein
VSTRKRLSGAENATRSSSEPCELLEWDTDFWGVPIARVVGQKLTPDRLAEIDGWCAGKDIACAYFVAALDDFPTVQAALEGGFKCVEVRAHGISPRDTGHEVVNWVRPFEERDRAEVARLARKSYGMTRFYNDPEFPNERCADFYERWTMDSCDGRADHVLVAEIDGRVVGYASCVLERKRRLEGRVPLLAIETGAGGLKSIGIGLAVAAHDWLRQHGARRVHDWTSGANAATTRIAQHLGYYLAEIEIWFHKWYRPGALNGLEK